MQEFVKLSRDYEVILDDGSQGRLTLGLGDMAQDNALTRHARSIGALAFGLIAFADLPGAPAHPMLWAQTASEMVMTLHDSDAQPGPELQRLMTRHFARFFEEIKDEAPELADIRIHPKDPDVLLN